MTGYILRAFLFFFTLWVRTRVDVMQHHTTQHNATKNRIVNDCKKMKAILHNTRGKTQYPKTQTLWKKLMVPPNNCPFNVRIPLPSQIITKTPPKAAPFCDSLALNPKVKARIIHKSKGPHKSQFFNSF